MKTVSVPKSYLNYLSNVLGVNRLFLSGEILEEREDARSWVTLSKTSGASWMIFVDLSSDAISSEEEELLFKMLGAMKLSEGQRNIFLLPEGVELVEQLQKELPHYKKVLCLGERAAELVAKQTKDTPLNTKVQFFNQSIGGSYSLDQLIKNPGLKAQTWNLMKSLLN